MEEFVSAMIESMKMLDTGKMPEEVRWYFENVTLPTALFENTEVFIDNTRIDPLYPYRIFDSMITGMGMEDPYTFIPEMTFYGELNNEDKMLLILMPEAQQANHSYAAFMFTDKDYDYPGFFLIVRGEDDALNLVAWDEEANKYNMGIVDNPEEAAETAYEAYVYSRDGEE